MAYIFKVTDCLYSLFKEAHIYILTLMSHWKPQDKHEDNNACACHFCPLYEQSTIFSYFQPAFEDYALVCEVVTVWLNNQSQEHSMATLVRLSVICPIKDAAMEHSVSVPVLYLTRQVIELRYTSNWECWELSILLLPIVLYDHAVINLYKTQDQTERG